MCRFYIRTASLKLPIKGCSFQCYREVEVKSCCPGFWGPDCAGGFLLGGWGWGGGCWEAWGHMSSVGSRMQEPGLPSSAGSASAGLKRADVLLRWSRGPRRPQTRSPALSQLLCVFQSVRSEPTDPAAAEGPVPTAWGGADSAAVRYQDQDQDPERS